jgi:hypothetical protein
VFFVLVVPEGKVAKGFRNAFFGLMEHDLGSFPLNPDDRGTKLAHRHRLVVEAAVVDDDTRNGAVIEVLQGFLDLLDGAANPNVLPEA